MVDAHLNTSQTMVGRVSDGTPTINRGTRDGSLVTASWYFGLVLEDRVFGVNMGSASTPHDVDNGASTTVFDDDQPTFGLDIPDNTVVMPLEIIYQVETHTGSTPGFLELAAGFAPAPVALGVGTSTPLTAVPLRIGSGATSNCTARGPYTGDASPDAIITLTGYAEFFRSGYPAEADPASRIGDLSVAESAAHHEWSALADGVAPIIVGPAILTVRMNSNSDDGVVTGFMTVIWAELPESAVR